MIELIAGLLAGVGALLALWLDAEKRVTKANLRADSAESSKSSIKNAVNAFNESMKNENEKQHASDKSIKKRHYFGSFTGD